MISNFEKYWDNVGYFILRLTYPHRHNDHQPWLLRSQGLVLFLVIIIITQVLVNFISQNERVLGFATNISATKVINLTNQERVSTGLSALKTNTSLNKAAEQKAQHMFEQGYWAHFAPDGRSPWYFFGLVGYEYNWAGENLARDFATSSGVLSAWMDSSGHRANILNGNFSEIGVAVVNGNLEGDDTTLVVQLFGKPLVLASSGSQTDEGVGSESSSPSKVSAQLNVPAQINETAVVEAFVAEETTSQTQVSPGSTNESLVASFIKDSTSSQKVTILLLSLIVALFILDSFIIYRKRHTRTNSHSLSHVGMIVLLILVTLLYGRGSIL